MSFAIVSRDRISSAVHLLAEWTYESRRDALAAVPSLIQDIGDAEVFVVDLSTAAPVLFVPLSPEPATVGLEPIADAWEVPAGGVLSGEQPRPTAIVNLRPRRPEDVRNFFAAKFQVWPNKSLHSLSVAKDDKERKRAAPQVRPQHVHVV